MSFYETLFPFYDQIFPLNKPATTLLLEHFQKGDSILDIGAGTGSMAVALAEKGLNVTAIEPESEMAETIQKKAEAKELHVQVDTIPMEEVDQLAQKYDGIYCIGNTLPHLQGLEEIAAFLKACFEKLEPAGELILQTVNFDKVLSTENFSFPVIEKEDFTFKRVYENVGDKILFTASITTKDEAFSNSISLYPVTSEILSAQLKGSGFKDIQVYGNFKKEAHSIQSPAIVAIAKK